MTTYDLAELDRRIAESLERCPNRRSRYAVRATIYLMERRADRLPFDHLVSSIRRLSATDDVVDALVVIGYGRSMMRRFPGVVPWEAS